MATAVEWYHQRLLRADAKELRKRLREGKIYRPEKVEQALTKFGQYVEVRENHSNLFIMGNDRTGLWKKVLGLSKTEDIAASFRSVLDDENKPES